MYVIIPNIVTLRTIVSDKIHIFLYKFYKSSLRIFIQEFPLHYLYFSNIYLSLVSLSSKSIDAN